METLLVIETGSLIFSTTFGAGYLDFRIIHEPHTIFQWFLVEIYSLRII